MKNKISDLNNHLFAQIERLSEENLTPEQIDSEFKRGAAIVAVADQILRSAHLQIQAAKILSDHGLDPSAHLALENQPRLQLVEVKKA
jgi:hypothetical protein